MFIFKQKNGSNIFYKSVIYQLKRGTPFTVGFKVLLLSWSYPRSDNLHLCCVLDQVVGEVDRPFVPLVVGEVGRVGGVAVEHVAAGQEEAERGAVLVVVLKVVHIYVVIVIVTGDVEGYSARILTQLVHD